MENFSKELNETEVQEIIERKIDTYKGLISILLKRVHPQNVGTLASILKQAILSSISVKINDEIEKLFIEIRKNPSLLFKKEIQIHIEGLIQKRLKIDKKLISQRTSDISKLILEMEEYFNEAISNSGSGIKNVIDIKDKIEAIDVNENSLDAILQIKNDLINITSIMEEEMRSTSNKLESSKNQIQTLEDKIKNLENELIKTQTENIKDHLTGVLTRRVFNKVATRIESAYNGLDTNYALIFFDIDHFECINDSYGYECGDTILSAFGEILNKKVREYDLVGRYSGAKFIAIIYFRQNDELLEFLKDIKTVINENSFMYENQRLKITFSSGVAIRSNHPSYEDALQNAIKLLYKAKDTGRNKILLENGMEI